jgi:hypothetical protein
VSDLRNIIRIKRRAEVAAATGHADDYPNPEEGREMAVAYERLRKEARGINERAGWGSDGFDEELPPLVPEKDGPPLGVHFDDHDQSWDAMERGTQARFRLRQLAAWAAGHQEAFEVEGQMRANAAAKMDAAKRETRQPPGFRA